MTAQATKAIEINELDLIAIERQARAMQARALADAFAALRRGISNLFARGTSARTA